MRRKRSITEVRDRTTRASRTARSARAAASGMKAKLADRRSYRYPGASRPDARRAVEHAPDGGPTGSRAAPRRDTTVTSSRTRMWSIWLWGRARGIGAPAHRAPPARQHRDHARTPEIAVAGDHRGPIGGRELRAQRVEMAQRARTSRASKTRARRRRRPACRPRRPCTPAPIADSPGRRRRCRSGSSARR